MNAKGVLCFCLSPIAFTLAGVAIGVAAVYGMGDGCMIPDGFFECICGFIGGVCGLAVGCAVSTGIAARFELSDEEIEAVYSSARSRSGTLLRPIIERDTVDYRALLRPHDD